MSTCLITEVNQQEGDIKYLREFSGWKEPTLIQRNLNIKFYFGRLYFC